MRFLAAYIMRGRMQAVAVTSVAAVLSLLLPPLSYLSGGAAGLVTLRVGPWQGLAVIGGATLAMSLLSFLIMGQPAAGLAYAVALWLPVWALSVSLRRSARLDHSVRLAGVFGGMLLVAIHFVTPEPAAWWEELFRETLSGAGAEGGESVSQLAQLMTGVVASALTLSLLGCLFIARWWQALLYNPGGFRQEFHGLRLGKAVGVITAGVFAVAFSTHGALSAVATDLLMVLGLLYLLQGLAVSHGLVASAGAHKGWLIGLYALLLIALPQTAVTLAVAGFADSWFDFRAFFAKKAE